MTDRATVDAGPCTDAGRTAAAAAPADAGRTAPPRRKPPRRSHKPAVIAYLGSLAAFAGVLALLSWRVAAGGDPAIGPGEPQAAAPAPARQVLVRRVVRRVIVTREAPEAAPAAAGDPVPASAPAPAPAAPAAPAPAPAPAAPTTRAS